MDVPDLLFLPYLSVDVSLFCQIFVVCLVILDVGFVLCELLMDLSIIEADNRHIAPRVSLQPTSENNRWPKSWHVFRVKNTTATYILVNYVVVSYLSLCY